MTRYFYVVWDGIDTDGKMVGGSCQIEASAAFLNLAATIGDIHDSVPSLAQTPRITFILPLTEEEYEVFTSV